MKKTIIDQYTDRLDLSPQRKWQLRNPQRYKYLKSKYSKSEKGRLYHRQNQDLWRDTEKGQACQKRYLRKVKLAAIAKLQAGVSHFVLSSKNNKAKSIRREAIDLLKRGKDPTMVAMWLKIPMSMMNELAKQINEP